MVDKKQQFGEYLVHLRNTKLRRTQKGYEGWTQADLADTAGISRYTIPRIEKGTVVDLLPHLDKLANAFELNEIERRIFYAKAGHVYDVAPSIPSPELMRHILENIEYPTSIRTSVWDFLAFNEYHKVLWSYSDEGLKLLGDGSELGANLFRVLFSPEFQIAQGRLIDNRTQWQRNAISQFRRLAFPYVTTHRYNQIINLMQEYREFKDEWLDADARSRNDVPSLVDLPRGTELNHPEFRSLKFISLRVPQRDIGEGIKISVYVPSPLKQENFDRMMASVTTNRVYLFDPRPIE